MSTYVVTLPDDKGVKYESFKYPAGETQVRIQESEFRAIREATKLIVKAKITSGDGLIELALLTDAIRKYADGFAEQILILPYLPYSRADRRFVEGDCFGLKVLGGFLDRLNYDRVSTYDAHNPAMAAKYIANFHNISMLPIIDLVNNDYLPKDTAILLPDEGAKRYGLEKYFDVYYATKERDPKTGKLSGFKVPNIIADSVLIVDDICDGGGTFIGLSQELQGIVQPYDLYLYVTHGIFSNGYGELDKHFTKIFTTDSFAGCGGMLDGAPGALVTVINIGVTED